MMLSGRSVREAWVRLAPARSAAQATEQLRWVATKLLDGKQCALEWQEEMANEVQHIVKSAGRPPGLGVVLVGDRPDRYATRRRLPASAGECRRVPPR